MSSKPEEKSDSGDLMVGVETAKEPDFEFIRHDDRDRFREKMRIFRNIPNPVDMLISFANGKASNQLLFSGAPEEIVLTQVRKAQEVAFQHIQAQANSKPLLESVEYVQDVHFELGQARDVEIHTLSLELEISEQGKGMVIMPVRWKVSDLLQHLERKLERREKVSDRHLAKRPALLDESSHSERDQGPTSGGEPTAVQWRHLARAVFILERYPDLETYDAFKSRAADLHETLNVVNSEGVISRDPGEAIKKGVIRLRQRLTQEDGTPARYHGVSGFRSLVIDLVRGENVRLTSANAEQDSKTA